jgi:hypothetical protein
MPSASPTTYPAVSDTASASAYPWERAKPAFNPPAYIALSVAIFVGVAFSFYLIRTCYLSRTLEASHKDARRMMKNCYLNTRWDVDEKSLQAQELVQTMNENRARDWKSNWRKKQAGNMKVCLFHSVFLPPAASDVCACSISSSPQILHALLMLNCHRVRRFLNVNPVRRLQIASRSLRLRTSQVTFMMIINVGP